MRRALLVGLALLLTTACTGLTLGENKPGGSTNLEYGSIAVDPKSEVSYVMETKKFAGVTTKTLYSIHPDAGNPIPVVDLTDYEDIRIVFPKNHVLVMAEKGGVDSLMVLDPDTMAVVDTMATPGRYKGGRGCGTSNIITHPFASFLAPGRCFRRGRVGGEPYFDAYLAGTWFCRLRYIHVW